MNEALVKQIAIKHYKAMCAKELGHLSTIDTIASAIREAISSVPVMGEAVAWRCFIDVAGDWATTDKKAIADNAIAAQCEVEPLYLAPTDSITREELDGLRKDAGRYRWLRDPCRQVESVVLYSKGDFDKGFFAFTALDESIDCAMQEGK